MVKTRFIKSHSFFFLKDNAHEMRKIVQLLVVTDQRSMDHISALTPIKSTVHVPAL